MKMVCEVCEETVDVQRFSKESIGWITREVKDVARKQLAEGVREFDGVKRVHFCPNHTPIDLHVDVRGFVDQKEDHVLSDGRKV